MSSITSTQILNAGFRYISGLNLAYANTSKINIATGRVRDSLNENDIVSTATLSININDAGIGGIDIGTLTTLTYYYLYIVGDSSGNNKAGAIFSLSNSAPQMPRGYDMFALLGGFYVNVLKQVQRFSQVGGGSDRSIYYAQGFTALASGFDTEFTQVVAPATPAIPNVRIYSTALLTPLTAGQYTAVRQHGSNAGVSGSQQLTGVLVGEEQGIPMKIPCDATPSFDYLVSDETATVGFLLEGYEMSLI